MWLCNKIHIRFKRLLLCSGIAKWVRASAMFIELCKFCFVHVHGYTHMYSVNCIGVWKSTIMSPALNLQFF